MNKKIFQVWIAIFVIHILAVNADPGGSVYLQLKSLKNPPKNDFYLEIWVTCDGLQAATVCLYGVAKTGDFSGGADTIFGASLGSRLSNPLKYNFTLFRGTFGLHFSTFDITDSRIKIYTYKVPYYPKVYGKRRWENTNLTSTTDVTTKLRFSYNVFCNEHYYGPACIVGCLPGKTYTCNPASGRKLCNGGWLGPECNCTMTARNTCDALGKMICYPSWYGEKCETKCNAKDDVTAGYTCDSTTGKKLCLSGWYGVECDLRTPPTSVLVTPYITSTPLLVLKPSSSLLLVSIGHVSSGMTPSQTMSSQMTSSQITSSQILLPMTSPQMTSSHITSSQTMSSQISLPMTSSQMMSSQILLQLTSSQMTSSHITSSLTSQRLLLTMNMITKTDFKSHESIFKEVTPNFSSTTKHLTAVPTSTVAQTISPSKPSSSIVIHNPGVNQARKKQEIWWILLLTLVLLAFLIIGALLAYRQKRKKCSINPESQNEIPLKTKQNVVDINQNT